MIHKINSTISHPKLGALFLISVLLIFTPLFSSTVISITGVSESAVSLSLSAVIPEIHHQPRELYSVGSVALATPPPPAVSDILWNRTYGGTLDENGLALLECADKGFIITGDTRSFGAGGLDIFVVRTDPLGYLLWNHTFGGTGDDGSLSIVACDEGGFAIAGWTNSFGAGGSDMWVIRIDANGNHLWNQTYGTAEGETGRSIVKCTSGGFAITGWTSKTSDTDAWLVRIDENGNELWNQTYGYDPDVHTSNDRGYSLVECSDGGFGIVGYTLGPTQETAEEDIWLIRTDNSGNHLWNYTYGGADRDWGQGLTLCRNGDFAITGYTHSWGSGGTGTNNFLVRTDSNGNELWHRAYSGTYPDYAYSVKELRSGGFALAGIWSWSGMYVECTNSTGYTQWRGAYGGHGYDVIECSGGGLALIGRTSAFGAGGFDMRLVRLQPVRWIETPTDQIYEWGESFRYDLNATSDASIDSWWLNDTSVFAIDTMGVITNQTALGIGEYPIEVCVNDTLNNWSWATFTITVQDTTPPTWDQTPTNQLREYGTDFQYDVNASDLAGIDYYAINDTINFAINPSTGIITNATALAVGTYGLDIWAFDIHALNCLATIQITIEDTIPPQWDQLPVNQLIEYGNPFLYTLFAFDPFGIDHWWINDTGNFAISAEGIVTNETMLHVGSYGLEVRAYDGNNLYCSAAFAILVEDTTCPVWLSEPTDQVLDYGQNLDYQLEAWDLSGIDHWGINDTVHFAITNTGRIINMVPLGSGTYYLLVTVGDIYNNELSVTIAIFVRTATLDGTSPFLLLLIGGGIAGGVIITLLIVGIVYFVMRRKRPNT